MRFYRHGCSVTLVQRIHQCHANNKCASVVTRRHQVLDPGVYVGSSSHSFRFVHIVSGALYGQKRS